MNHDGVRHTVDTIAAGGVVLAWLDVLQPAAAILASLLAAVWYGVQIYRAAQKRKTAKEEPPA